MSCISEVVNHQVNLVCLKYSTQAVDIVKFVSIFISLLSLNENKDDQ